MSIKATVLRLLRRQTPEQYQIIEALDVFGQSVALNSPDEQIALHEALSASRFLIARNSNPSRKLLTEMGWSPLDAAALFILQWMPKHRIMHQDTYRMPHYVALCIAP